MTEQQDLLISGIQHFCFCRRQWALIHIEAQWQENVLTAEGRQQHARVHDAGIEDFRNGILTLRGLPIRSNRLQISGVCDAVEFIPVENGITLHNRKGCWQPKPVEYKHGSSKVSDCDRLQLTAQVLCLEEMLCCTIAEADLYYVETRHREHVYIDGVLRNKAEAMLEEMRGYYERGYTPKVKPSKACANCSLKDICLPEILKKRPVSEYIKKHAEEADFN